MYGGGPNPDDFNKPTEQEKALTETAAKQFNEYIRGKAVETDYREDISRDPLLTAEKVQGEAATDLAVKAPTSYRLGLNTGLSLPDIMKGATRKAKIYGDLTQDAVAQQAAGRKAFVENSMGIQSTANTAQANLAQDAVNRNIADAEGDYNSNAASMRSIASFSGAGAGLAYGMLKKPKEEKEEK